jgi:hypothetical protein
VWSLEGFTRWLRDCPGVNLPAFEEMLPILVHRQVGAVEVDRSGAGFAWIAEQLHAGFLQLASPLLGIAGRTCADEVGPSVVSASIARDHMVDRQARCLRATVLAGVVIAPEQLALAETYAWTWPFDHVIQADNGRARE